MLSLNNINELFLMIIISLCLLSRTGNASFFDDVGGFFNDVGNGIVDTVQDVGDGIGDAVDNVGEFFDNVGGGVTDVVEDIGDAVDDVIPDAVDAVKKATEGVKNLINKALEIDNIIQCAKDGNKQLKSIGDTILNDAEITLKYQYDLFSKCYNKLKDPVRTLLSQMVLENYSKDTINQILDILKSDCVGNIGSKTLTIEIESSITAIAGLSISGGLAIDFNRREIYMYAAGCGYIGTDLSIAINSDIAAYLFDDFKDVAGCSKFYSLGGGMEVVDVNLGATVVFNVPTTKRIATGGAAGIGVGVSAFPAGAEYGTCYTLQPQYCGKF